MTTESYEAFIQRQERELREQAQREHWPEPLELERPEVYRTPLDAIVYEGWRNYLINYVAYQQGPMTPTLRLAADIGPRAAYYEQQTGLSYRFEEHDPRHPKDGLGLVEPSYRGLIDCNEPFIGWKGGRRTPLYPTERVLNAVKGGWLRIGPLIDTATFSPPTPNPNPQPYDPSEAIRQMVEERTEQWRNFVNRAGIPR